MCFPHGSGAPVVGHLDVMDPGQVQQGCPSPGLLERGGANHPVPTTPSQHSRQTQGSQQGSQGSRAAGVPTSFPPGGCAGQAGVPGLYAQQQPQQGDRQTQTFVGAQGREQHVPRWTSLVWCPVVAPEEQWVVQSLVLVRVSGPSLVGGHLGGVSPLSS